MKRTRAAVLAILGLLAPTVGRTDVPIPQTFHVEIRGSLAMGGVARLVAERFMQDHPDAVVTVAGGGTHRGMKSLVVGTAQLAMGTDSIPEDIAKLASDAHVALTGKAIFSDAVAVVVHPKNPLATISMGDLCDIFRGKVIYWKDIGRTSTEAAHLPLAQDDAPRPQRLSPPGSHEKGPRAGAPRRAPLVGAPSEPYDAGPSSDPSNLRRGDIEVITFEGNEGPYETFKKEVLGDSYVITPNARNVSFKDFYDAITEKAIGYIGIHGVKQLKVVSVDGVLGTVENVRAGRYPIRRELWLYERDPAPTPARAVLDYFLDPAIGQRIAESLGNVPVR